MEQIINKSIWGCENNDFSCLDGSPEHLFSTLDRPYIDHRRALGSSWGVEPTWDIAKASRGRLGQSCRHLERLWAVLRTFWPPPGPFWGPPGLLEDPTSKKTSFWGEEAKSIAAGGLGNGNNARFLCFPASFPL